MTTKELMVGDWVFAKKTPEIPFMIIPRIEKTLDGKTILYGKCPNGGIVGPFLEVEFQPIPLTPEILEKNGFKECNKDTDGAIQYELGDESLGVDVWVNTEPCLLGAWRKSYSMINELPISFVHELQHCLNLVGIKKEIEL